MPAALFALQSLATPSFRFALYALVLAVGILVGLEIPLVMRILKRHAGGPNAGLKTLVSQVLTFDYLGALAVSIAFPLLFVPQLGLIRTGAFFGLLNAGVAVWALWLFRAELRGLAAHAAAAALTVAALGRRVRRRRSASRPGPRTASTPTASSTARRAPTSASSSRRAAAGVRLFLNGNLQFHSRDEYRYHEALVHPALAAHGAPKKRARPRRRRRHGGARGAQVRERRARHAGRARSAHDAALLDRAAAARPERRLAALAEGDDRQRRRVRLARAARRDVRRDRRRLPRPDQLLDRQALHADVLRAGRAPPGGERLRGRADDLAADRAEELLDGGDDDRGRGPRDGAVPRPRAELRRVGLHRRQPAAVPPRADAAAGAALPHRRRPAGAVRFPARHGARARPRSTGCRTRSSSRPSRTSGARCSGEPIARPRRGADAPRRPRRVARRARAARRLHARRRAALRRRLGRRRRRARPPAAQRLAGDEVRPPARGRG